MKILLSPYLLKATAAALVGAGVGYAAFSPFYETGTLRYEVPLFGAFLIFVAYSLVKGLSWLKSWIRGIGIGWLIVGVAFWGQSSDFYGQLAIPMLIVESLSVLAALGLLALSFTPAFQKHRIAG